MKISELDEIGNPTGSETVVVLADGISKRAVLDSLVDATVAPVRETLGATVAARDVLYARDPAANIFTSPGYDGLCVPVFGSDLADATGALETWLTCTGAPLQAVIPIYRRTASGAASGAGGIGGDTLMFTVTRPVSTLVPPIATDGSVFRVVLDFLHLLPADDAAIYLPNIELRDADGDRVNFGFLYAVGEPASDDKYPIVNGYFREGGTNTWSSFGADTTAAFRWLSVTRQSAVALEAGIQRDSARNRRITVGAPPSQLSNSFANNPGLFWHELAVVQGGLVTRIAVNVSAAGWVKFVFGERQSDGSFVTKREVSIYAAASGVNTFDAGAAFDAFTVEAGWYFGARTATGFLCYSQLGNCWIKPLVGDLVYYRGATPAIAATIDVGDAPRLPASRNRVTLWREDLDSTTPPVGWDTDGATYTADGMSLGVATVGWATRLHTHQFVRVDRRLTRVLIDWTTENAKFAVATAQAGGDATEFLYGNSSVLVDGADDKLWITSFLPNAIGEPTYQAVVDLGFAMTVGHQYWLEWTIRDNVHSARLVSTTTGAASPTVTTGSVDFNGVDTDAGNQNSQIAFIYPAGNARVKSVEVLHDDPPPKVYVAGDSLSHPVSMTKAQSWPGLLRAAGVVVARSTQGGSTSEPARRAAGIEIAALKPEIVINATGANDLLQGKPIADTKFNDMQMLEMARRVGAIMVVPILHPYSGWNATALNAWRTSLAEANADVKLWRWDKAVTVNGDGSTIDTAMVGSDLLHWSVAGAAKIFGRLQLDVPGVTD